MTFWIIIVLLSLYLIIMIYMLYNETGVFGIYTRSDTSNVFYPLGGTRRLTKQEMEDRERAYNRKAGGISIADY